MRLMRAIRTILLPTALLTLALAGCHGNQNQNQAQNVSSDDPASVNLANASNTTTASENPPAPPPDQGSQSAPSEQAPPPDQPGDQSGYGDQYPGDSSGGYSDTAYDVASDPPPPIPDYDQPECPGDGYEWTPGYWAYSNDGGYYWVPGAWVMAPYVGVLWTPGYWGYNGGHYRWNHGYWGPHIGFYGGVNYGFGYDGNGYEGGYWRGQNFYYNTSVNRVNVSVVRNVYNYRITNNFNSTRVSYNGGNGGLNYRPTQAQAAAHATEDRRPAAQHRESRGMRRPLAA